MLKHMQGADRRTGRERQRTTTEDERSQPALALVTDRSVLASTTLLVILSIAAQVALDATAVQDDAFDSPLYPWTWVVLPLAAAAAAAWRPFPGCALLYSAALVLPMLVGTFLLGSVFYDGSGGASFWPISEIINLVQGPLIFACARLAAHVSLQRIVRTSQ